MLSKLKVLLLYNIGFEKVVIFVCFVAIKFVIVVEKLASFPSAVANSASVFNASGDEFTKLAIAVATLVDVA